jgi:RHS repeat-associated protein
MGRPTVIEYGHASTLSQDASYDSLGRLTGLERPLGASRPAALSATVANSWGWTLDGANDWDSVDSTGGAVSRDESRVHDDTHALKEVYDAVSSTTELLGHDWNGNLIWDDSFDYVFDAYNRLRHVSDRATGNVIAVYDYDVEDRRIRKSVTHSGALNGVTMFVYDAEDVVAEYDDAGTLLREFVHGPGYDEVLVMNRNTGGGTTATGPGDERYYYTHDALGSTVALVSAATGKAVEGYLYEPYGATYVVEAGANGQVDWGGDDTIASYSGLDNPHTFTGQRFDAETGLMYYKARYYSSEQGRFISRDPIGIWTDEANLGNGYAYIGNTPLTGMDPTGEWFVQGGGQVTAWWGWGRTGWSNWGATYLRGDCGYFSSESFECHSQTMERFDATHGAGGGADAILTVGSFNTVEQYQCADKTTYSLVVLAVEHAEGDGGWSLGLSAGFSLVVGRTKVEPDCPEPDVSPPPIPPSCVLFDPVTETCILPDDAPSVAGSKETRKEKVPENDRMPEVSARGGVSHNV